MPPRSKRPQRAPPLTTARAFSQTSPLLSNDIGALLANCVENWHDLYSEDEKRGLIMSFPPGYRIYEVDQAGRLKCPITSDFARNDSYIQAASVRFRKDLGEGYYETKWQKDANLAMSERAEGKFDEYLDTKVEEQFGDLVADGAREEPEQLCESSDGEWGKKTTTGTKRWNGGSLKRLPTKARTTKGDLEMCLVHGGDGREDRMEDRES